MELSFIKDKDEVLGKRIESSIEYIYSLYEDSKQAHRSDLYRTETYRVILLYVVSIIEAVLFYIYDASKLSLTKIEYKSIHKLPKTFIDTSTKGQLLLAVETKRGKTESEINLRELVQFLVLEKVLKKETAERLFKVMEIRNSIHLRQTKQKPHTIEDVSFSLDLLAYVIINAAQGFNK
jgi:hypothetical protein